MRLTILGGGGFRVPLVYAAVAAARTRVDISEVALYDTDAQRLATMERVLAGLPAGEAPRVTSTTDLDEAISGAAVIFSAIRVGGTDGRTVDERVAISHGLLGQETIGAGGLAYGLRTIGVAEHIAARAAELAPQAWIISFTNPAGMITEAMRAHTPQVVGICDTPIGLVRRVARVLDVDIARAEIGYLGLNHLGWLRSLVVDGADRLPDLLADDALLGRIEEARTIGPEWVRATGSLPNEYLYYYYLTRTARTAIAGADRTRGEFLDAQQGEFYRRARTAADAHEVWSNTLAEREATYMAEARDGEREAEDAQGGGYHEVAVDLMAALLSGEQHRMILNVPNDGAIPTLPADAVIEIPCRVDGRGIHPERPAAGLDLDQLALVTGVKAAERALIHAARTGSRADAWHAFGIHPLVDSVDVARDLVAGYIAASPAIAAVLDRP